MTTLSSFWVFPSRYDDYDYGEVNQLLERNLKVYIKTVACYPEKTTRRMYNHFWRHFRHSEKVRLMGEEQDGSLWRRRGLGTIEVLTQGSNLRLFMSPASAGRFFTTSAPWEAHLLTCKMGVLSGSQKDLGSNHNTVTWELCDLGQVILLL